MVIHWSHQAKIVLPDIFPQQQSIEEKQNARKEQFKQD